MSIEWSEVDLESSWWTIPGEKTKNGLSHRVPLTAPALGIIQKMISALDDSDSRFVFPSPKGDTHISNPQKAHQRIQKTTNIDFVGHDFRPTAASMMTGMGITGLNLRRTGTH